MLGVLTDQNVAGKGAHGTAVEHILVEQVACASFCGVLDEQVVVYMLLPVGYDTAIGAGLGTLSRQADVRAVTGQASHERDAAQSETAVVFLVGI